MLKGAPLATALVLGGCVWEPVQEAPPPGNSDSAPVIESAIPNNHQIAVSNDPFAECTLRAALPMVYSPRGATLTARFFLNYDDPNAGTNPPLPVGGNGQPDIPLQVSTIDPNTYSLAPTEISLVDFLGQLFFSSPTNVLWVFVSDDFNDCPYPTTVVTTSQSPSSDVQNLDCYTTSWFWLIDPTGCAFLTAP